MALVCKSDTIDETLVHTFHFQQSDEVISLTQKQLEHIPYLNTFVFNVDKFTYCRSEDNGFVLGHPIQYILFNPIVSAVVDRKPSYLFAKLPRHANVFCMFELYDYLCIDPLPVPSLKPILETFLPQDWLRDEYHTSSPSEARDTAVEFVIAIASRKYDLNNSEIVKTIFDLLVDILSSISVFGQRLRYQTLMVVENCCFHIFTSEQRVLLRAYKRSLETLSDSNEDPDDTDQFLEAPSTHLFYWRKNSQVSTNRNSFLRFCYPERLTFLDSSWWHMYPDFDNYRSSMQSHCARLPLFDPALWFMYPDFDNYWSFRQPHCERCYQQREFAQFERSTGCKISCPCGFLNHWARKEYIMHGSEPLEPVVAFYQGDYSQLKRMDFKTVTCLVECCSKLQSAKNKRERQFVYSSRPHYPQNAPVAGKCKNKPSMKAQKYR